MPQPEIPIERIQRTGQRPGAILGIIRTAPAVVRHLGDVTRGAAIRLAGEETAVGVLTHADDVREFDPLERVDVHAKIPALDLGGVDAGSQAERSDDHQPLDVMRIRGVQRLAHGVAHTVHLHLASPEPGRQRVRMTEPIGVGVAGHLGPIDAADVFAPADDLTDEAFRGRQWVTLRITRMRVGGGLGDFRRRQQLHVEGEGQPGVEEPIRGRVHGVLVVAELRQSPLDEGVQLLERLLAVPRPREVLL